MGSSLARGLLASMNNIKQVSICENDSARQNWLKSEFPQCRICQFSEIKPESSTIIILAVKPQDMRKVCRELQAVNFPANTLYISIAAGITTTALQKWLGMPTEIVRCMPNTPAAIGAGITGLYTDTQTSATNKAWAEQILGHAGQTIWFQEESNLDVVTALSGSGPAYLFYFMECLQESGKKLGLNEQDSYALTLQTIAGAAKLAQHERIEFPELRAKVTSKGGTTERAINYLIEKKFAITIHDAVKAAKNRAEEISQSFDED